MIRHALPRSEVIMPESSGFGADQLHLWKSEEEFVVRNRDGVIWTCKWNWKAPTIPNKRGALARGEELHSRLGLAEEKAFNMECVECGVTRNIARIGWCPRCAQTLCAACLNAHRCVPRPIWGWSDLACSQDEHAVRSAFLSQHCILYPQQCLYLAKASRLRGGMRTTTTWSCRWST